MSNYEPYKWTIIGADGMKEGFKSNKNECLKVLASFKGGYLDGDSWRLSSGIESVVEKEHHYEIKNHSGSVYKCAKGAEGFTVYTATIFAEWQGAYEGLRTYSAEECVEMLK